MVLVGIFLSVKNLQLILRTPSSQKYKWYLDLEPTERFALTPLLVSVHDGQNVILVGV